MKRGINTAKLTKAYIESKVSQELIISKYLNIPLEVINDCIDNNKLITSVFRNNDYNGSMGIQYNKKGRLKVRDFGGFGFFGDAYDVVAYVLSAAIKRPLDIASKQDFYFILQNIATTFHKYIYNEEIDNNVDININKGLYALKQRKAIIELAPRSWNKDDKLIWAKWGVSLGYLNTHFVIPVEQYYIDRSINKNPKYYYKATDPCYAYMLGQNKSGIYLIKLYFPLRDRHTNLKFITNCNVIEGLPNLELNNYDYILITKSSKDRLSIGCHLDKMLLYGEDEQKLNIGVVNLPSENYKLTDKEYQYLCNKLAPNGKIFSLLDFDTTGRLGANYLYETYNIPYLFITRGELGLPNYGGKDFTDLHSKYTIEELNNFIKETLRYVKLKYSQNNSSKNWSEIPYFST